ncbi:MAG: DUF4332 domain-containing protein [Halohasta sp.]
MALLNKLKSMLGIGGSRREDERTETSVTVEREASDAAADGAEADESADDADRDEVDESTDVESDTADDADRDEVNDGEVDEPVAAGTDAAASTGSLTEPDPDETETATEPSEAVGPPTEPIDDEPVDRDVEDVIDEAEAEPPETDTADETIDEDADDAADETSEDDGEESNQPVTTVKGIGPAYSERLEAAGIASVADLAEADAETLADEIDVSPKVVDGWVDRAREQ